MVADLPPVRLFHTIYPRPRLVGAAALEAACDTTTCHLSILRHTHQSCAASACTTHHSVSYAAMWPEPPGTRAGSASSEPTGSSTEAAFGRGRLRSAPLPLGRFPIAWPLAQRAAHGEGLRLQANWEQRSKEVQRRGLVQLLLVLHVQTGGRRFLRVFLLPHLREAARCRLPGRDQPPLVLLGAGRVRRVANAAKSPAASTVSPSRRWSRNRPVRNRSGAGGWERRFRDALRRVPDSLLRMQGGRRRFRRAPRRLPLRETLCAVGLGSGTENGGFHEFSGGHIFAYAFNKSVGGSGFDTAYEERRLGRDLRRVHLLQGLAVPNVLRGWGYWAPAHLQSKGAQVEALAI